MEKPWRAPSLCGIMDKITIPEDELMSQSVYDIYLDHAEKESPDQLLERIRRFFDFCGEQYREGLMTEEDLLVATYYEGKLYEQLWALKNVQVDELGLSRSKTEVEASWEEWKKTGRIGQKTWMRSCLAGPRDADEAADWVFRVIDACKVPLCQFDVIPVSAVKEFPNAALMWTNDPEDRTVSSTLFLDCYDRAKLLHSNAPVGKTFTIHLEGGLTVELTVEEVRLEKGSARRFLGTGTVTDYVEKPGPLEIIMDETGFTEVILARFHLSPWQRIALTIPRTIPHPKWTDYEMVRLARAMRIETEYKILRLPYLMGGETAAPRPAHRDQPEQRGKVVYLFGGGDEQ